ncbi:MAG: hypothetical protein IJ125_03255 [Atopobiaceae bacterium]|nr:hypothetical protein [Atopobiaceae bacterium]
MHYAATAGAGYPAWVHGWSMWMAAAAILLGAASVFLAARFHAWHERDKHSFAYELAIAFMAAFFVAALVVLAPVTLAAIQGSSAELTGAGSTASNSAESTSSTSSSSHNESQTLATTTGFHALSLEELRAYFTSTTPESKTKTALYIGREGCGACRNFLESASPALEEKGRVLLGIDLTEARAESGSNAVDALLDEIEVHSVPVVLVVHEGQILQRISSPANSIDDIVSLAVDAADMQQGSLAASDAEVKQSADSDQSSSSSSTSDSGSSTSTSGSETQCPDGSGDCAA